MGLDTILIGVIAIVLAAGAAYFLVRRAVDGLESRLSKRVVPVGALFPFGGGAAPEGYHLADGSLLDPAQDAALCALVKDHFLLPGDSPTDCRLPDLRGRVAVGTGDAQQRNVSRFRQGSRSLCEPCRHPFSTSVW